MFCFCSAHFPSLRLIIVWVLWLFSILSLTVSLLSVTDQRNSRQMLCSCVPIATSIFIFVSEPSEGLKAAYITMFCCRRLLQSQLASSVQTRSTTLISNAGTWTQTVYPQSVKSSSSCVLRVPSATRSSPCSTASLVTSSWWLLEMHRPRCWTGTASTSWSVSKETSTLWIWPTPRWRGTRICGFGSVCFSFDLNIHGGIDLSKSS